MELLRLPHDMLDGHIHEKEVIAMLIYSISIHI